jgi:phosphate-selective porin OprO/OprP
MFWKKNKKAMTTVALAALAASAGFGATSEAFAQATINSPVSGAPEIREGQQRFKMRGRFQYDILSSDFDVGTDDGTRTYVRRAFLGAQGRFTDHWRYKIDFVLNPGATESATTGGADDVAVDDAYLEYAGDFFSFVIGEHNITAPLEDRTSSLDTPFNERSSFINAFGYGRSAGVGFLTTGANWMAAVAVQGDSLNNQDAGFTADEMMSYSGRFTWAPIFESSPDGYSLVHLGVSGRYRYAGDDANFRFRSRPFLGRGARPLDVGSGAAVLGESDSSLGLEAAVQYNAFGATAEYSSLNGETAGGAGFGFSGYYVDVFWSPTGEARSYRGNQGSFGPVIPRRSVADGGWGHWMVSARYDQLEMSDLGLAATRGEQTGYAVALDWVPVDHVKFKLNFARTEFDLASAADEEAQIVSLRTQFDF